MNTEEHIQSFRESYSALRAEIGKVIVGHDSIVGGTLLAVLAGGHVLLEGVPGLGKTLLVRTLSEVLDLSFNRIQFSPGPDARRYPRDEHRHGSARAAGLRVPISTRADFRAPDPGKDEINRATPKTQSAMLEAMQEKSVTAGGGEIRKLVEPFFRARHAESDRPGRNVSASRGATGSFLFQTRRGLSERCGTDRSADAQQPRAPMWRSTRCSSANNLLELQRLVRQWSRWLRT